MSSPGETPTRDGPSFSFGEMALSERTPLDGFVDLDAIGGAGDAEKSEHEALLHQMRKLMLNEQFSPEVLSFSDDIVPKVQELVTKQMNEIDEDELNDEDAPVGFEAHIKRMELDRVNYLLRSYFRLRLKKIEKYIFYIFQDNDETRSGSGIEKKVFDRLSKAEQDFAVAFMDIVETHFKQSFLTLLPERLRKLDKDGSVKLATPPNLEKFTFCRMLRNMGSYAVSDRVGDLPIDLNQGDIICARYSRIQKLVDGDNAELV